MRKSRWFSSLYIWLVMAFLYAPIAVLIIFSFNDSKSRNTWTGFTLRWYEELFHDRVIMQSFLVMLVVAIVSSVIATVLGTLAAIAPYYAGDAINMMAVNESLRFVIPKEGTNLFFDAVCIPKIKEDTEESRLKKLASEMYINFLNEPEIAAANIEYIQYSTPNDAALALLDEETRNNPVIYPSDDKLENTEVYVNLSEDTNRYLDQLWTEIMSAEAGYNYWSMPLFLLGALALSVIITLMKRNRRRRREQFSYADSHRNF